MRWFVLIGLVLTFGTAVLGFLQSKRNTAKIGEVHVLVNSQLTAMMKRVDQLTGVLQGAGLEVPKRLTAEGDNPVGSGLCPIMPSVKSIPR